MRYLRNINLTILIKNFLTSKSKDSIFYLFLLVYVSLLLYLCNKLMIQIDEAFTLNTTGNRLLKVIDLSYFFEGQPPFYFLVLALWRKISSGIFFARLLSVIFTLLSAFVLSKLLRLLFDRIYSKWIIVLFLLNPFTVWASMEIRTYSLIILLSALTIYFFYLIYYSHKNNFRILFVLMCTIGIYTQYYFIFLIFSLSIIILIYKGWRSFINYYLMLIPVALLVLPNLFFIKEQFEMHQNTQVTYTFLERLKNILFTPEQFIFPIGQTLIGRVGRWILRLFLIGVIISTVYFFLNKKSENTYRDTSSLNQILLLIASLLVIFLFLFSFTNLIFHIKYLTIAFPFFCLIFAALGIYKPAINIAIYVSFALIYILVLLNVYKPPFIKTNNPKSIAFFVENIEKPQEPILFHDKSLVLLIKPYYQGSNPLIPLPNSVFDYNYFRITIQDTIELDKLIKNAVNNSRSFILINGTDLGFVTRNPLSNKMIDLYLKNNYLISNDTIIEGVNDYDFLRARRLSMNL
jgi:hypothetical protein